MLGDIIGLMEKGRKFLIWGMWLALAVALVAGGWLGWKYFTRPERHKVTTYQDATSAAINQALKEKNYNELNKILAKTNYSVVDKTKIQVGALLQQNKSDDALALIMQVEQHNGLDYSLARTTAEIYAAKGDKAKAIEYYNKTLDLLRKSDDPMKEDDMADVTKLVTELQK